MIKKISALIIIVSIFVILLSCSEDATSPKTPDIEITNPKAGFVWGDTVEIQVRVSNTENLEMIKLFIDNDIDSTIIFEDYIYPFNFNWNTEGQRYGKYYIQARLYKTDGTSTKSEIITVTLSPCPVYEEDLQNFQGITETDSIGNLIGNIDSTDWYFEIDTLSKRIAKDDTLPVELSYFYVEYYEDGNFVSINWGTLTETDNLGWNIYRGMSENAYENGEVIEITPEIIPGQGTTSEPSYYVYQDPYPVVEDTTYWYWLESVDYNGERYLYGSEKITIPEIPDPPPPPPTWYGFKAAYPNPCESKSYLEFCLLEDCKVIIIIIDENGEFIDALFAGVCERDKIHTIEWNASEKPKKLYRCIIQLGDSLRGHGDILVE